MNSTSAARMNHGTVWSDAEVKAHITIWGDSKIQDELDGAVRNKIIFVKIAKKLQEQGYNRDWQQCRVKLKNLKSDYSRGRKSCKFYSQLDGILGTQASFSTICFGGLSSNVANEPQGTASTKWFRVWTR